MYDEEKGYRMFDMVCELSQKLLKLGVIVMTEFELHKVKKAPLMIAVGYYQCVMHDEKVQSHRSSCNIVLWADCQFGSCYPNVLENDVEMDQYDRPWKKYLQLCERQVIMDWSEALGSQKCLEGRHSPQRLHSPDGLHPHLSPVFFEKIFDPVLPSRN